MRKAQSKSPIPVTPLHKPGENLQKQIIHNYIGPIYFIAMPPFLFIGVLIGSFNPVTNWISFLFSLVFLGIYEAIVYFFYVRHVRRKIANLKLGYDGEVYVGQLLDEMRVNDWLILHDFDTGKGNIDHIIIAPQGVFTLETKTVRKVEGETTIFYDCQTVSTEKRTLDSPLNQAKAEAAHLAEYLNQKLTMKVFVQPIVTYPGWEYKYNGRQSLEECEVWICRTISINSVIEKYKNHQNAEARKRIYNFLASENRT